MVALALGAWFGATPVIQFAVRHPDDFFVRFQTASIFKDKTPLEGWQAVARTTGEAAALTGSVRSMLHDMDPTLALINVTTMDELRDASLGRTRFLTILMLMFGVIGLVLIVTSRNVAKRLAGTVPY